MRINQLQDDSNYGQDPNRDMSQKEQDRKKVERWIGKAWDELEKVAKESPKTKVTEKAAQREKQEDRQEKITEEKKTVSVKKKNKDEIKWIRVLRYICVVRIQEKYFEKHVSDGVSLVAYHIACK